MVMIGTDSHKRTHTVVAVDDVGRRLGVKTVRTNSEGHLELVRWSAQFDEVAFALEDCRHLTAVWRLICSRPAVGWCGFRPS